MKKMLDLNLYKNYNMSLSEIHKLKHQETEKEIEAQKVQQISKVKPLIKYGIVAFFAFILAAGVSFKFILSGIDVPVTPAPNIAIITTEQMNTVDIQIKTVTIDEYIQIQVLDFVETGSVQGDISATTFSDKLNGVARDVTPDKELLKDIKTPDNTELLTSEFLSIAKEDNEAIKKQTSIKAEKNPYDPIKQGIVTPALMKEHDIDPQSSLYNKPKSVVKALEKYSLNISGVDGNEYNTLLTLATAANSNLSLLNTQNITKDSWTVYKVDINGAEEINGLNVTPIQTFVDKDEAIVYAQDILQVDSFIKLNSVIEYKYNINVCCMDLNEAKRYAQKSGIVDKTFSLQKIVNN